MVCGLAPAGFLLWLELPEWKMELEECNCSVKELLLCMISSYVCLAFRINHIALASTVMFH